MIKLVRYLSYILLFFVVVFATLPKTNIYYFAQQKLYNKYKIKFISKDIKQNITKLSLEENKIIFDGIKVANIDNILIKTYIAYNQIIFYNIKLDSIINKFAPSYIGFVSLKYSLIDPTKIKIELKTKTSKANGYFDIIKNKLQLTLTISQQDKNRYYQIVSKLQKTKQKGIYKYEYIFK